MAENLDKKVLEVAGLPSNKKVIKFKGDDNWYDIAENVQKYDLTKYGIVAGAVVDVTFDENKNVVYLKVKPDGKAEAPVEVKEESKPEAEAPAPQEDTKEDMLVIAGVARNKKVLKFKNQDGWSELSEEIQKLDYEAIGLISGATVIATINDKGVITAISAQAPVEEVKPDVQKSYSNDAVANSIEAQVAWKGAVEVAVAMITAGTLLPDDVEAKLKELTAVGITAIAKR